MAAGRLEARGEEGIGREARGGREKGERVQNTWSVSGKATTVATLWVEQTATVTSKNTKTPTTPQEMSAEYQSHQLRIRRASKLETQEGRLGT